MQNSINSLVKPQNAKSRKTTGRYKYLAKNSILFSISSFGSKLLVFLLVPLYTNVLSTSDYGIVDIVLTVCSLLIFIVSMNIESAVLRFSMDGKRDNEQRNEYCKNGKLSIESIEIEDIGIYRETLLNFGMRLVARNCLIFTVLLFFFSWFNPINWPWYCYVFLLANLVLQSFSVVVSGYIRGIDKVKDIAVAGVLVTFITIMSNMFFLLAFHWGVIGYMLSVLLGGFSGLIYNIAHCGNILKILKGSVCDYATQRAMIHYSFPLILNGVAWWVNSSIDRFFVVSIVGIAENGIYAVSSKIPTIMHTLTSIFLQAWSLSAIKDFNSQDREAFYSNIYKGFNATMTLTCSILILFNRTIARVLFAKDFFIAWRCSSWLLISVLFSSMASFVSSVFGAVKNNNMLALSTVVSGMLNMILNVILIPKYKAVGAAIATVCSFAVVFIIRYIGTLKYIKWKISLLKDCKAYGLLIVQVIFETNMMIHTCCIIGVLLLCSSTLIKAAHKIINKFRPVQLELKDRI